MVKHPDSVEKIISYIEGFKNSYITISSKFFRDYTCPSMCGGCCYVFTLDYFENSERWEKFKKLYPDEVKNFTRRKLRGANIFTNYQTGNKDRFCMYLDKSNGRCKIHEANPFSCEFELLKVMQKDKKTLLMNRLFGRGWNFTRVDGKKGALCEMKPFNYEKYERDLSLLKELHDISLKLNIESHLKKIIKHLDSNSYYYKLGFVPTENINLKFYKHE